MRYILLLTIAFLTMSFGHKFYVSMTDIQYNAKAGSLEITMKMFADDLETAIRENEDHKLWIGDKKEAPEADGLIEAYLKQKFELEVNGQPIAYTFLGKEVEADAIWCYMEVLNVEDLQTLNVRHRVFLELFDDQKNLVHLYKGKQQKSVIIVKGQEEKEINVK